MIYLDNAATTEIDPRVLDEMMPYLKLNFGNPGSAHSWGRIAAEAVSTARQRVADFLNCSPEHVVFTSGGSESNNTVLSHYDDMPVIISATEHDSIMHRMVLDKAKQVLTADVDKYGVCDANSVKTEIALSMGCYNKIPGLVSVMYANNEVPAVNPVKEIAEMCHAMKIKFHTDCVQAAGFYDLDMQDIGCDFASISSHKIHGPKGVGALYVRNPDIMKPLIYGGLAQEYGLRGGTENVPGIVGFGKACEIAKSELKKNVDSVLKQKLLFLILLEKYANANGIKYYCNGDMNIGDSGKVLSITIPGVDAQTLSLMLDTKGVLVSTGSACRSHETSPSRTLNAIGLSFEDARSTIRVSFSGGVGELSSESIDFAAKSIIKCAYILKNNLL